ncbi:MAG: sensor diguanylate cyclase [Hyphomicrobiales bacterium]|nr:sensor diguanylate cyclase [Hyphomicrobiales bacterium]
MLLNRCFDEQGRLSALRRYQVLDTAVEPQFETVITLVKQIFSVPMCAVSLIDSDRQWFKAKRGLELTETARDIAFCDYTIRSEAPLLVDDALCDVRFANNPLVSGPPFIRSYAGVPLTSPEGYNIGSLCVIDTAPRHLGSAETDVLVNFGKLIVELLELREIASVDGLTNALTRGAWLKLAAAELSRSYRYNRSASIVMLDVDHFKAINDRYGHAAGDEVLQLLSSHCMEQLRLGDAFGRIGGEEFAILLLESDLREAMASAERLRQCISRIRWSHVEQSGCITASFGVASSDNMLRSVTSMLTCADQALYAAKRNGRNRCEAYCAPAKFAS